MTRAATPLRRYSGQAALSTRAAAPLRWHSGLAALSGSAAFRVRRSPMPLFGGRRSRRQGRAARPLVAALPLHHARVYDCCSQLLSGVVGRQFWMATPRVRMVQRVLAPRVAVVAARPCSRLRRPPTYPLSHPPPPPSPGRQRSVWISEPGPSLRIEILISVCK